jgi:hypothetical protein
MRKKSTVKRLRVHLEITQRVKDMLTKVMDLTEAGTMTEVFVKALAIYEIVIDHYSNNGKVILKDKKGIEKELLIY